jgi:septin 7
VQVSAEGRTAESPQKDELTHASSHYQDIVENGVRLRLTVVDTPGFGDFVNNDDRCVLSLRASE